ncbi:acetate--CoA ligase family protein [Chloroflexota bacterium]
MGIIYQLNPFLEPHGVALIGVSRRTGSAAFNILENILNCGYKGKIYPVNPGASEILGVKAFSAVKDLPNGIDLAVIATPREAVLQLVRQCIDKGIRCITVVAQGFADADEKGKRMQKELVAMARSGGVRIIGPNTFGTANAFTSFSSSFAPVEMEHIPIGLICQTGVFFVGFTGLNLLGKAIDVGNACDVDIADALEYFKNDPQVRLVVIHTEGIPKGRRFMDVAARATREKPVLVWKTARTDEGARAAASHTGSITGRDEVWNAALKRSGVIRVSELDELKDMARAFSILPPMRGRDIAVISFTGGFNIMTLDACARYDIRMAPLGPRTMAGLTAMAPPWLKMRNPVDIWTSMASKKTFKEMAGVLEESFRLLLSEPAVNALLFIGGTFELNLPPILADVLTRAAKEFPDKPVTSFFYGRYAMNGDDVMTAAGRAANFTSVERAVRALSHMAWYHDRVLAP